MMVQIDRGAICGVVRGAAPLHQVDSAAAALHARARMHRGTAAGVCIRCIRGFSTGRNKSFRQNHSVMMRKEYELSMEIPKFGIFRLYSFLIITQ